MNEKEKQLWAKLVKVDFPKLHEDSYVDLLHEAALTWGCGGETKEAMLFDRYIMMRNLLDLKEEDK